MKILEIRDNGGKTFDRYTVIYDVIGNQRGHYSAVGMSARPFHPLGFSQHCTAMPGKHLGKKITFRQLPKDCQRLVKDDLRRSPNMKTQSETHTPTPWTLDDLPKLQNTSLLCVDYELAESNREFIIRAVNAHETLLEALIQEHKVVRQMDANAHDSAGPCPVCDLIAQAEGKE